MLRSASTNVTVRVRASHADAIVDDVFELVDDLGAHDRGRVGVEQRQHEVERAAWIRLEQLFDEVGLRTCESQPRDAPAPS